MPCISARTSGRAAVVIVGLVLVWLARLHKLNWLFKADPLAALFVAVIVVHVSWRLARQTIDALLDSAPHGVRTRIMDSVRPPARSSGGGPRADQERGQPPLCRSWLSGSDRNVTFQASEQVAHRVTETVRQILPGADVVVNTVAEGGPLGKHLRSHPRRRLAQ